MSQNSVQVRTKPSSETQSRCFPPPADESSHPRSLELLILHIVRVIRLLSDPISRLPSSSRLADTSRSDTA